MYQLQRMLKDLLNYVYQDDPKLKGYQRFYLEVLDKEYKSRQGDYNRKERLIRLMNTYRNENKLVITSIHELAHHVTYEQGSGGGHGKEFYFNYEKLLHGALDMGLFTKSDWLAAHRRVHDSQSENKVQNMILRYTPKKSGYKAGKQKIIVYDAYEFKDELKERGYKYNKIVKGWEIEVNEAELESNKKYLEEKGAEYTVTDANRYIVKSEKDQGDYTVSIENGYQIKDVLRENGFRYRPSDHCWYIRVDKLEARKWIDKIAEICDKNEINASDVKQGKNLFELHVILEKKQEDKT